jgi:hypothetical protein
MMHSSFSGLDKNLLATINSERCVGDILRPFFGNITEEEKTYGYFMQDGATAHTATYSNVLNEVFENRLISRGLWPARSPDLNPRDFYLWRNLKDKENSNNPHTLVELSKAFVKQCHLPRSVN